VKIRNLKSRADALAADARTDRLEYRQHLDQSLSILRRRVGSTAGLTISFSLGFMTGTGSSSGGRKNGKAAAVGSRGRRAKGFAQRLVRGPMGENAMKLASAAVMSSLMKFMNEHGGHAAPSATASTEAASP
jgi:hypothetical protein